MARACTVCTHPDRPAIDQAMVNRRPFREIARHFNVSKDAALRHHDDHLPETLAQAKAAEDMARADDLVTQVAALRSKALGLLLAAERAGDFRACASLLREARGCIELLAEMRQAIDRRPVVNLLVMPEWLTTRSALIEALRPYPDARAAVSARLLALEPPT